MNRNSKDDIVARSKTTAYGVFERKVKASEDGNTISQRHSSVSIARRNISMDASK